MLARGVLITMVRIEWDAAKQRKRINPAFSPPKNWHQQPPLPAELVTQLITRGANAYLYRLPDDVWVVDADTPAAVDIAREHFATPPAVTTRKGAHWLFRADGPLELEGTYFDAHQPRQLYGPGSYYDTPDGPALYDGSVPPWDRLPAAPEQLRGSLPRRRLSAGPGLSESPSGFFAPQPATPEQAKAAIGAKLTDIENGRASLAGGRDRVMAAAFLMGGYLWTGWFDYDEAEGALLAACSKCWGAADDDDAKWIRQGLEDGDRPTNRLPAEKRVALTAEQVSGAVEGGPFDYGDPAYYANPEPPLEPVYGAFGGSVPLFYDERVHWLQGESESGKTWVGLAIALEVLQAGKPVIVVDHEDTRSSVLTRLKALGMTAVEYSRLVYIAAGDVTHGQLREHLDTTDREYGLMLVDGVTSAVSAARLSGRDEQELTRWVDELPRRVPMSICIDHVVKAIDDRRGMAVGTQAKKAVVTGSAWEVVATSMFGRGRSGTLELRIQKDKPGGIRGQLPNGKGVLKLALTSELGGSKVRLSAAGEESMFTDPNDALFGALYADGIDGGVSALELLKASKVRGYGYSTNRKADMHAAWLTYYVARKDGPEHERHSFPVTESV